MALTKEQLALRTTVEGLQVKIRAATAEVVKAQKELGGTAQLKGAALNKETRMAEVLATFAKLLKEIAKANESVIRNLR